MPQGFWANYYRKKMRPYPMESAGVKSDWVRWVRAGGGHTRAVGVQVFGWPAGGRGGRGHVIRVPGAAVISKPSLQLMSSSGLARSQVRPLGFPILEIRDMTQLHIHTHTLSLSQDTLENVGISPRRIHNNLLAMMSFKRDWKKWGRENSTLFASFSHGCHLFIYFCHMFVTPFI